MRYLLSRYTSRSYLLSAVSFSAVLFALLLSSLFSRAEAAGLTPFRSASSISTGQTLSITLPLPTGTLAGDVMIAAITIVSPGTGLVFTAPPGWVMIRQDITTGEIAQALFYKVASNSEFGPFTFSHNQSREASGAISSYWGIDTANPINANSGQFNSGSPPTAPSVTTSTSGTTLITIFGTKDGTTLDPPTAMVERWRQTGINGIQGFDELFTGSGATGPRTATSNGGVTIGQLIALQPGAPNAVGTVLFTTRNLGSLTLGEQVRVDLIESWGFTVRQIFDDADPIDIAPELALSDVVYISEESHSNDIGSNYTDSCLGVVFEEQAITDELFIAGSTANYSSLETSITNTTHYITQLFPGLGFQMFFDTYTRNGVDTQTLHYLRTTVAPGAVTLATAPNDSGSLVTLEIGATLNNGSAAAGRRVFLPWGASTMNVDDILTLIANGQQMMRRSIEWGMAANSCAGRLIKRAFLPDGTPLPSGETVPVGNRIKFLIYFNNSGAAESDVSVQDILDNLGFLYNAGTIKVDNTYTCASNPCTATDEANIFAAIDDNTALTDITGDDVASFTGGDTIDIGNSSQATNAQLDIGANSVLALLFTAQMR